MSFPGPLLDPAPADGPDLPGAERGAEAALRAQTEFLTALCAEARAGLNGVLALAELLATQPLGGDAPAYVRTLGDCGRTLLKLVADAAELARPEDEAPPALEAVRLRDLLDGVQADWLPRALEDGVGLGAVFQGEAGLSAELDAGRLRRLFDALIGHALKLTRRGGVEASLSGEREGDRVVLRGFVRDTGPRLDPARLPTLFEPFGPAAHAAYGTGLELALARRMVEALGGRIWAENNAGAGSAIFFDFDALACKAAPTFADEESVEDPGPPLSGHILIVDDNATNRMVARTLVELFGCTCETADDGLEALEAIARGRFDAVLMDIRMPRMDGVEAARAIRAMPGRRGATPIIALTANAGAEDGRAYRAAGMLDLVEKPIKAERLLLALAGAFACAEAETEQAAA